MVRPPQRARTVTAARARRWLVAGVSVLWFCLCGESPEAGVLRGVRAQSADSVQAGQAGIDARCKVEQKKPLFVGFAVGMTLDAFEPAAQASREIWRATKHWLCDARAPLA